MKFVCLGYMDEAKWNAMSQSEQDAMVEECLACDQRLLRNGHWTGSGEALQSVRSAKTLRLVGAKLIVTDGPYAETKEQLGGLGVLEAQDMDHAVELMSKHPGVHYGPFEIRPVDTEMTDCAEAAVAAPDARPEGMKVICLGYGDERKWNAMSEAERKALVEECLAYGEALSAHGAWGGGEALQDSGTAKTLRSKGGKVLVTDGPYAETREQLGGVAAFWFRDMEHAIEAWSKHPCLRVGDSLELRPADAEFNARITARLERA